MVDSFTHRKVQYLHLDVRFKARHEIVHYFLFKDIIFKKHLS